MNKPLIGIPMGDPAGIGPEIVVKALIERDIYDICRPLVIGSTLSIKRAINLCKLNTSINVVKNPEEGEYNTGIINLIDVNDIDISEVCYGKVQCEGGRASYRYIEKTVEMAMANKLHGIATTPINKESLKLAGVDYIGHTEILAGLTGSSDPLTMFEVGNLRVFFLSRHMSLKSACEYITEERILSFIEKSGKALKRLGIKEGTMAVAGLNPHCGEHGLFGHEEVKYIEPGIKKAREKGYCVEGPIGADSVFYLAHKGKYNSVLSLYHDQGHIATKTLDFERTISITIGLPFIRTSVDHGTAFDIAGKGIASSVSMTEAIKLASKYSEVYNKVIIE